MKKIVPDLLTLLRNSKPNPQPSPAMRRVLRSSNQPKPVDPPPPLSEATKPKRRRRRRRADADPWTPRRKPKASTNPRPRPPPPTHFTCRICAEEKPVEEFIKWVPASRIQRSNKHEVPFPCISHLSRNPRRKNDPVCKECISNSMSARLDTVGARKVGQGCLEPGCASYWDFAYIMKYMPNDSLEKYNLGMLNVWKESTLLFTCINESCGYIGLLDSMVAGYPQIECPECKERICASCKIKWHTDFTCAEYAARHVNEKMTDKEKETLKIMQEKDGKRCPNCYMVIEKDGGCDSMYCMGCRTYFNWATAASAVPGAKAAAPMHSGFGFAGPVGCELDNLAQAQADASGPAAVAATA